MFSALAPMVIALPKARVNRIPKSNENPREIDVSSIPARSRRQSVYVGFIAILKLPFKFDRS
jgi:hypothetical protein